MFNKLNGNIKNLDLEIRKISEELEEMPGLSEYEATIERLKDLTELRSDLADSLEDGDSRESLTLIDNQIKIQLVKLKGLDRGSDYADKLKTLDELSKIRGQLNSSKGNETLKSSLLSGAMSLTSLVMILKHEETNVITTKAYDIFRGAFRGGK